MMMSPEHLKAIKRCCNLNGEISNVFNENNEPICPICGEPLIKIKKYVYKSNCKHIDKNINIGYLGNKEDKNDKK